MRGFLRALGWLLLAFAAVALGADGYWSWKAGAPTFEPVADYLARLRPHIAAEVHGWVASLSPTARHIAERLLVWPAWGLPLVLGGLLVILAAPRERLRSRGRRIWSERGRPEP